MSLRAESSAGWWGSRLINTDHLRFRLKMSWTDGGDPFSLQGILGHSSQETTSKYVNRARTNVKSQNSKYSPGERLG